MAKTSEIIKILEEYAPPELAESWDNSGWQVFLETIIPQKFCCACL